jgi:hypothetical protein
LSKHERFCEQHGLKFFKYVGGCRWEVHCGAKILRWSTRTKDVTLDGVFQGKDTSWIEVKKRLKSLGWTT